MTRCRPWWWLMMLPMVASAAVRDLWAPDEPRYAVIAREMYEGGSFIVMHLCGEPYADKPPLQFWLSGLFGWLGGWEELLLRLPVLLATFGTAWLVARLAHRFWGEREANWAPALFLGFFELTWIGGRLQVDPLLAFLCTLSLDLTTRPPESPQRRFRDVALAGAALGLAGLTKGPVAWLNVGLPLLAWRWLRPHAVPRSRRAHWFLFALLGVLPVLAWGTAVMMLEPALADDLLFKQHVGRISDVGERHPGPPYEHLVQLAGLLLPWTLLVGAGVVAAWRELRRAWRRETADDGLVLALLWLLPLFLFYSAIPPKRELYLLPVYPALALLAARPLARAIEERRLQRWLAVGTVAFVAVLGVACAAAALFTDVLPGLAWRGPLVGLPLMAGALVAALRWRRDDLRGYAGAVLAGWCATWVLVALLVLRPLNPLKSSRALAAELAARPEKPVDIPCLIGVQPAGFRFYSAVPTVRADDLRPALARDGASFLGLVNDRTWNRMDPAVKALFRVVAERRVGSGRILILGAATPPAPE